MICPHVKIHRLFPGEEAEHMKPPYTCARGGCSARPFYRCLSCGVLVCEAHTASLASLVLLPLPPPSSTQAPLRRGDPITSVVDGTTVHAFVRLVYPHTFRWKARDLSTHDDVIAYEHIEWERGHLDDPSAKALLAAHALHRNR